METSEEDLTFFQRHAATLQTYHLDTMGMTSGTWVIALPRIRSCLKHTDNVLLEGILTSCAPLAYHDLGDALSEKPTLLAGKERTRRRKALQAWFKDGGACPMVESWSAI